MKKLSEIFKQRLLDVINNNDLDDKTMNHILGILSRFTPEELDEVIEFFNKKGLSMYHKQLIDIFQKYNLKSILKTLSEGESIELNDLLIKTDNIYSGNIYDVIIKKFGSFDDENNIRKCLQKLAALDFKNKNSRGIFEILLELFLSGERIDTNGDITRPNYRMEVKGPTGRMIGQYDTNIQNMAEGVKGYVSTWDIDIDHLIEEKGVFSSNKSINKLFNGEDSLCKYLNTNNLFNLIQWALICQFEGNPKHFDDQLIKKLQIGDEIKNAIIKEINGLIRYVDAAKLRILMGCVQLYYYKQKDKFSHIIIFKGSSKENSVSRGDYIILDENNLNNINTLWGIVNKYNIHFELGGRKGSSRDNACQIMIK